MESMEDDELIDLKESPIPTSSSKVNHSHTDLVSKERGFLANEPSYSTLLVILQSPNFIKTLNGPFTFFIPSNEAFRQMSSNDLQALLRPENREPLLKILENHLVPSKVTELNKNIFLKSVNGNEIKITSKDGLITVNGAHILKTENIGSNGVVYIVDTLWTN